MELFRKKREHEGKDTALKPAVKTEEITRFRRLRSSAKIRDLVAQTHVRVEDLIYPIFIVEGENICEPVESMPEVFRYSIDRLDEILDKISELNISGVLVFGVPEHKDELGSEAYNPDGVTARAIRYIKEKTPELIVIADVCLCEYTDHGHCGVVDKKNHTILNDETLPLLSRMACVCAKSGADIIAPSDMMDGDVSYIRRGLDAAGFNMTPIMGYSAKFASVYYSPFRDAADSTPHFGDRSSYQMDIRNGREAIRMLGEDVRMGADIIMVKPALAYLDIVKKAREKFELPIAVYNVSGEYSLIKAAAQNGWIDEKRIVMENMIAFKRAGADIIITYHALDVARWLSKD